MSSLRWVLAAAALQGAVYGAWVAPTLQSAVEAGQVYSGLVTYERPTPFSVYLTKSWTLINQAAGLLLSSGLDEWGASRALSVAMGALGFSAVAAAAFALGAPGGWAALAPFWVVTSSFTIPHFNYPPEIAGTWSTYGTIAVATLVLTLVLLAFRRDRAGALLLGLAPAIHPNLGAWTVLLAAVHLACGGRAEAFRRARAAWRFAGLGLALSIASFVAQFTLIHKAGIELPADERARLLAVLIEKWDNHRNPGNFHATGFVLAVAAAAASAAAWFRIARGRGLRRTRAERAEAALAFARIQVVVLAVGAAGAAVFLWAPLEWVPWPLIAAMPMRLLAVLTLAALWNTVSLPVLFAWQRPWLLLVPPVAIGWAGQDKRLAFEVLLLANGFIGAALVAPGLSERVLRSSSALSRKALQFLAHLLVLLAFALFFATDWGWYPSAVMKGRPLAHLLLPPAIAPGSELSRGGGWLVVGPSLHKMQLFTRRPVLMEEAVDYTAYVPEVLGLLKEILADVYGVDFHSPPQDHRATGGVPYRAVRDAWAARSVAEWKALRRKYGVGDVAVRRDWTLQLPRVHVSGDVALFRIPAD